MTLAKAKEWIGGLPTADLPVLAASIAEIERFGARGERTPLTDLADVVLHDPLFTLKVLAKVNGRRKSRLGADITTVEHAIMMMGVQPFLFQFSKLTSVEDFLKGKNAGLSSVHEVASRAHHAACQARDWAICRQDIESEEVFVATLLNEMPELLLWYFAPDKMATLAQAMRENPANAATAQEELLGFTLAELHEALVGTFAIPELLCDLMDIGKGTHPRALNVRLASTIARRAENGWYGAALADDITAAAAYLHLSMDDATTRIHRTAVLAARAWRWYGARPAAALLPLLSAPPLAPVIEQTIAPATGQTVAPAQAKSAAPGPAPRNAQEWITWALRVLVREVGLGRSMFALCSADRQALKAKWVEGAAPGSALSGFTLSLGNGNLFSHLMAKPQGLWLQDTNRARLAPFLTGEMTRAIGRGDFFAMSIFLHGKPVGLLYADAGEVDGATLDDKRHHAFKQVAVKLAQGLAAQGREAA
jgi:HD-like signal output (HDOD) protein